MPRNHWDQIREVFEAAVKLNIEERDRFLSDRYSHDPTLLSEVRSLLNSYDETDSFLESPVDSLFASTLKAAAFETGDTISHYRIVSLIGSGGMGDVYLAEDMTLDRRVALKVIALPMASDHAWLERFKREAHAASALNHPNIMTVFEFGLENGTHFLISEYVNGVTLSDKLKEMIAVEEALDIAIQIASALASAHKAGIIHRDIKPENIMVREDGLVKLLDFGLAKSSQTLNEAVTTSSTAAARLSEAGLIVGTAAYMSPEQASGLPVDERSDVFSFGVVLHEMLTGRLPSSGDSLAVVNSACLIHDPLSLATVDAQIPLELRDLVGRMIAKHRDERARSMDLALSRLEELKDNFSFAQKLRDRTASHEFSITRPSTIHAVGSYFRLRTVRAVTLITLIAAAAAGIWFFNSASRPLSAQSIKSIAVLPFENATGDGELDYLSDGLSESLIDRLSEFRDLKVAARNSSFQFREPDLDLKGSARSLSVDALILGKVIKQGEGLSVRVELIDPDSGTQLWGEQFYRRATDNLSLQRELALEVSNHLQLVRSAKVTEFTYDAGTTNPKAYEHYLNGRYHFNRTTDTGFLKARDHFQSAIEADPNYADAYAGLAETYTALCMWQVESVNKCFPKAKAAAESALEINEAIAAAHVALADTEYQYYWNFAKAELEYKRAIELQPNYAHTYTQYAHYLTVVGRFQDAVAAARHAAELEPLVVGRLVALGTVLYHARDYEEAGNQLRNAIELDANSGAAHFWLARVHADTHDYAAAISHLDLAGNLLAGSPDEPAMLAYVFARSRMKTDSEQMLSELNERAKSAYVPRFYFAMIRNALGDKDRAFYWLNRAVEEREVMALRLRSDPAFDDLHSDPRFGRLIRRIGFPEN